MPQNTLPHDTAHPLSTPRRRASVLAMVAVLAATLSGCATSPPPVPLVAAVKPSQVIPIKQVDRGVLMLLPTEKVAFDFGKASVTAVEAHEFLDRVAAILKDKTTAKIALEGHTDDQGSRPLNQKLSDERAEAIRQELVRRGVAGLRMSTAGFAFDRPVISNDTEAGRKVNRRVELIVLGETVANITRGEPPGSFEEAFNRLKDLIDRDGLLPAKGS